MLGYFVNARLCIKAKYYKCDITTLGLELLKQKEKRGEKAGKAIFDTAQLFLHSFISVTTKEA